MVNVDNVQLLVDRLDSGIDIQGEGRLEFTEDGVIKRCCLGVANRVAMEHGVEIPVRVSSTGTTYFNGNCSVLAPQAQAFFGFEQDNPEVILTDELGVEGTAALAVLNDGACSDFGKKSFAEISQILKDNFLS